MSIRILFAASLLFATGCVGAEPGPTLADLDTAGTSGEEKWLLVFDYGEEFGRLFGPDLAEARRRADALEPETRLTFYNGMAHTARWDVEDVDAQVEAIKLAVAEEHWPALFIGLFIRYTITNDSAPERVVPFAERLSEAVGVPPYDGVRIGVQRGSGDDMPAALAIAARYPDAYQPGIYEELGWRVGDDGGLADPDKVAALLSGVAAAHHSSFIHGACRASWRFGDPWDRYNALFGRINREARDACLNAIGFTIAQQRPDPSLDLAPVLEGLADRRWYGAVENTFRRSVQQDHSWFAPDLVDYHGADGRGADAPPPPPQ